jgi:hypothetical protein
VYLSQSGRRGRSPYTASRPSTGGRMGGTVSGKVRAAAGARAGRAAAEEGMTGAISVPVTAASRSGRQDRSAPWGGTMGYDTGPEASR